MFCKWKSPFNLGVRLALGFAGLADGKVVIHGLGYLAQA